MSFAYHSNDNVLAQLRAGLIPTPLPLLLGDFAHAETGVRFEYAERRWPDDEFAPDAMHIVYVGDGVQTRLARVMKTVAYVVVDEDRGAPVWERWPIKQHRQFETDWVRA